MVKFLYSGHERKQVRRANKILPGKGARRVHNQQQLACNDRIGPHFCFRCHSSAPYTV